MVQKISGLSGGVSSWMGKKGSSRSSLVKNRKQNLCNFDTGAISLRNHGFEGGPHRAAHLFIAELRDINSQNQLQDMATLTRIASFLSSTESALVTAPTTWATLVKSKFIKHCISQSTWSKTVGLSRIEGTTSFGIGTCDELALERLAFR